MVDKRYQRQKAFQRIDISSSLIGNTLCLYIKINYQNINVFFQILHS